MKIAFVLALVCVRGPASAYLRVHPQNPHYFLETDTNEPVMIASCGGCVPTARDTNYALHVRDMKKNHVTYGRVWHFLPWGGKEAIWPWRRSSVPGAFMGGRGGNKFDMDQWNPEYWRRVRHAMSLCAEAGIYAEIHLFDRCGMSPADLTRWANNPWASDNNINNLETPDSSKDGTPEFYLYAQKPNLRKQQERYITKMIDETIAYPTAIYEIENEHWAYKDPDWPAHYGKFIKDYIARKYPKSPRLVSYSSLVDDLEDCYDLPQIDIVNRHFGNEPERKPSILNDYIEPRWPKNKPTNIDEFANGVTDPALLQEMCWTIITSGGNFHIEDAAKESRPYEIVENIRQFRLQSGWDFIRSAPNKALVRSGNGCCMAQKGKEYVVYIPRGGSAAVDLAPAGSYHAAWWSTSKGGFSGPSDFAHAGGAREFAAPDEGGWVLHVKAK